MIATDGDTGRRLTRQDEEYIFRSATSGLVFHFGHLFEAGMTDDQLRQALAQSLGIFGGSGGPGKPSITKNGAGLRIWGAWYVVNHVVEKPLFEGSATIAMAREMYDISDPNNKQISLL